MKLPKKITQNTLLIDLLVIFPEAASILIEQYGLHCVGCAMAASETLAQGLQAHGYDDDKIQRIIKQLNSVIQKN